MEVQIAKNTSINLSSRIDKTIYNLLTSDAQKRGISINSLVNQILKKYISWERNADDIGFVPLSKLAVQDIFTELDEKKIKDIATNVGSTIPRNLLRLNFNVLTFNNILLLLEIFGERFGNVRHNIKDSKHYFSIYHGVNENFSIYLKYWHQALADDLEIKITVIDMTHNMLTFVVEER